MSQIFFAEDERYCSHVNFGTNPCSVAVMDNLSVHHVPDIISLFQRGWHFGHVSSSVQSRPQPHGRILQLCQGLPSETQTSTGGIKPHSHNSISFLQHHNRTLQVMDCSFRIQCMNQYATNCSKTLDYRPNYNHLLYCMN